MAKTKTYSIFDIIKEIIDTKSPWDSFTPDQQKLFNGYMINKFLSMNAKYIEVVNYVQGLNIKDSKKLYEVYCWMIPQSKNTYSPFIKSTTKKLYSPELLKHISEQFECATSEAEEYIQMVDKEWLEEILTSRGVDEKEIKKLIKNG
jgi:Golgi nucleoside diphosphatase